MVLLLAWAPASLAAQSGPSAETPPASAPEAAARAGGLHVLVSLSERILRLRDGERVLIEAPVAIGKPVVLEYEEESWDFSTPRGRRRVLRKEENPVWVPPRWHYVELAVEQGLQMKELRRGAPTPLSDGSRLVVRGDRIFRHLHGGGVEALPADEEVVFEGTLFVPPIGTANRRIPGELGRFKLDLGDGYYLHGSAQDTPLDDISTHGCVRLRASDLELLYRRVPVGTPVIIY